MRKLPFLRLYGNASFKRKSRGLTSPAPTTSVWVNVSVEVKQDDKPFFRKKSGIQIYIKNRIKRLKRDKIMYFTPFYALVGRGGFEPPKSKTSDLQSDPFGRSGIFPYIKLNFLTDGAGGRNRTCNLLITNQLLCQLSYTGKGGALGRNRTTDRRIFSPLLYHLSYQGVFAFFKA